VRPEEGPTRLVSVASFDLALSEVTVRQFRAFVQATGYVTDAETAGSASMCCWRPKLGICWRNPGFDQADDEPVLAVSWNDAAEFCRWLSRETGVRYRLPTEAEWEFAAKSDQENESLERTAWYNGNAGGRSHRVATRAAGRLGLHDVLGNAWEWVADSYHDSYAAAPATGRAWNENGTAGPRGWPKPGEGRVLRGGGWGLCDCRHPVSYEVSVTSRPVFAAGDACNNSGFRLARDIPGAVTSPAPAAARPVPQIILGTETTFVELPPGDFLLGGPNGAQNQRVHFGRTVRMMRDEVTVAQFRAFVEATRYVTDAERKGWGWDSDFRTRHATQKRPGAKWSAPGFEQGPSHPVTMVSWNDAQAFCRWLSAQAGRNYRLPTEAEWEYAATSGGTDVEPPSLADLAWYFDNSGFTTHPVGTRKANTWGLRDMLGNAAEWVLDVWTPEVTGHPRDGSAALGIDTTARAVRGGSYERERSEFGLRARDWQEQSEAIAGVGFRVVDATERHATQQP
jgi:formylglycine-generating enzyme required for sulfatase activity